MFDFDVLVIGAGSGGVRAARMLAAKNKTVAVVEKRFLGGTCVNVGCIPKKLFVYASNFSSEFDHSQDFGWQISTDEVNFHWSTLLANKNTEIARLNTVYKNLLENSGVTIIDGRAKFTGDHQLEVAGKIYSAENIIIATGGEPFVPEHPGSDLGLISDDMFYLEKLPESICVVGGGYIAVEFAGIFSGLGVQTHVVYRREKPLRGFDDGIQDFVLDELKKKGIQFHLNTDIESLKKTAGDIEVEFNKGENLLVESVLFATGRVALTANLGLEQAGVDLNDQGEVIVDQHYRTSVKHIFAIGDVIGNYQLTPVALAEGMYVCDFISGLAPQAIDYSTIPTAVFCQPNIGTVGFTEEQALDKGYRVKVFESVFKALKNTLGDSQERTFMKMLVDAETDRVLGVHMAGEHAGEIIQGIGVALNAKLTKKDFDRTIGIHPTAAEEFVTMREPSRIVG